MKAILEGLLFVVGDEGLNINEICEILVLMKKSKGNNWWINKWISIMIKNVVIELKFLVDKYKINNKTKHTRILQKIKWK